MKIHKNFQIANSLWYKIGDTVRYFIDVQNKEDIKKAYEFARQEKVKRVLLIGLGSNLLFTDEYFDGVIIRLVATENPIRLIRENIILADAGATLDDVIQFSLNHNLVGLEWAGGLPGNVGAAIRGNVGAFGGEIKDVVKEAEVFEIVNGKPRFKKLRRFELKFFYRNSIVKRKNFGVLSAIFRLKKGEEAVLRRARQTYLNNIEYRKIRHPLEFPNCGSVFKNLIDEEQIKRVIKVFPDLEDKIKRDWHGKVAMGYLLKRVGFASYRVGDALVSPKHCNFIVNLGNAKTSEVLSIIKAIQDKFIEVFDFIPELEVEIVK